MRGVRTGWTLDRLWRRGSNGSHLGRFDGQRALKFHAAASRLNAIAYSPDGKRLATGSLDGPIGVWDPATGKPVGILRGHAEPVFELAFSSDGTKLISAGQNATIKLWDLTAEAGPRLFRVAAPVANLETVSNNYAAAVRPLGWRCCVSPGRGSTGCRGNERDGGSLGSRHGSARANPASAARSRVRTHV